jgi:hypothetical protein
LSASENGPLLKIANEEHGGAKYDR